MGLDYIYCKIPAEKISSDLTHFPVKLYLNTSTHPEFFNEMSYTDRLKLQGVADNLPEELSIEIEEFTNENAVLHLSSPSWVLSSGVDNIFRIYYSSLMSNNTAYVGDTGTSPAQNVWDSHFVGVYHMAQDPSGGTGCILDSTSSGNDGTPSGSMTSEDLVDGDYGKALDFDGVDDYIDLGDSLGASLSTTYTLEALAKTSTITEDNSICTYRSTTDSNPILFQLDHNNADFRLLVRDDAGNIAVASQASAILTDTYYNFAGTRNGNTINTYLDGSAGTPDTDSFGAITQNSCIIGGLTPGDVVQLSTVFKGQIGEVRISSIVRSADWIAATYKSLTNNLVLYDESYTCAGTTAIDGATTSGIWVRLYKRDDGSFIGATISSGTEGTFSIDTPYNDYHYVIALMPTNSGINGLIYDWLRPGE